MYIVHIAFLFHLLRSNAKKYFQKFKFQFNSIKCFHYTFGRFYRIFMSCFLLFIFVCNCWNNEVIRSRLCSKIQNKMHIRVRQSNTTVRAIRKILVLHCVNLTRSQRKYPDVQRKVLHSVDCKLTLALSFNIGKNSYNLQFQYL